MKIFRADLLSYNPEYMTVFQMAGHKPVCVNWAACSMYDTFLVEVAVYVIAGHYLKYPLMPRRAINPQED